VIQTRAIVTNIRDLGADYFLLEVESPEIAGASKPGHFVNVLIQDSARVVLRRPIAVFDVKSNRVQLLVKSIGEGTRWISLREPGDVVNLLGPLGKGLFDKTDAKRVIMVAGGVGLAPLYYYLTYYKELNIKTVLFYGARNAKSILFQNELLELTDECVFVTEDGSLGEKGLVTDELRRYYLEHGTAEGDVVFACGPKFMLKQVVDFADAEHIECFVSLESFMGCGAGVCLSCVIPARHYSQDGDKYFKLCTDGPVINSNIIDKRYFEESYAGH
jgi:dihydroorotate dehydrogenase electron transfer subunit